MKKSSSILFYLVIFLPALLTGCQGSPVPHLPVEVVGLEEGMSGQEVKAHLGDPDFRQEITGGERWIYRHVNKSLLRRTPLIGGFLGSAEVDVVTVEFQQGKVKNFQYQSLTPENFKKRGYSRNG
ncbi:MAG: hypothetical protein ACLFV2_03490 [Desulfurivibrionaceae bacterium]